MSFVRLSGTPAGITAADVKCRSDSTFQFIPRSLRDHYFFVSEIGTKKSLIIYGERLLWIFMQ